MTESAMTRVETFSVNNAKIYPSGKKNILDFFKKSMGFNKVDIKDIDGNVLFEGKGSIRRAIKQAIKQGVSLKRADLNHCNLSNMNLKGIDLEGADLKGSDFGRTNLTNANLKGATVDYAYFYHADLENADLSHITNAFGANFNCTKCKDTNFDYTDLSLSDIRSMDLSEAKTDLCKIKKSDYKTKNDKDSIPLKNILLSRSQKR